MTTLRRHAGGHLGRRGVHGRQHLHRQRAELDGQGHRRGPRRRMPSFFGYMAWSGGGADPAVRRHDLHLVPLNRHRHEQTHASWSPAPSFPRRIARLRAALRGRGQPGRRRVWSHGAADRRACRARQGAFTTGSERIDAELLAACPRAEDLRQHGRGLQQLRHRRHDRARRAGHQHARRADRDHRRLRLRAADGHGAPHHRERAFPARAANGTSGATTCSPAPTCTAHARHPGHGPHRPGHRAARRARLRHEGDLSQPLAPARRRSRPNCKARATSTRTSCCATADHLVLVLPYSPASHHAIGAAELALMKPTATLVNIARGGIVDDAALAAGAARQAHRRRRAGRVRGRAQGASRPAHRAQRRADAAHRQRHRAHAPRDGRPGGRQPDRLPGAGQGRSRRSIPQVLARQAQDA